MYSMWLAVLLVFTCQPGCYRAAQYGQTGSPTTGDSAGAGGSSGPSTSFANGAPAQGGAPAGAGLPGSFVSGSDQIGGRGQTGAIRPGAQQQQQGGFVFAAFGGPSQPGSVTGSSFVGIGDTDFRTRDGQVAGFPQRIPGTAPFVTNFVEGQITPTVTQTVTNNLFTTLTDLVLHSVGVTQTQFTMQTATVPTQQVITTPVDDRVAISTTVVHRQEYVTVTETKSDFRLAIRTSVTYVTITHTSYAITNVPFTITATEVVTVTSPIVRTVINTQVSISTEYRTIANTVFVHGGYF